MFREKERVNAKDEHLLLLCVLTVQLKIVEQNQQKGREKMAKAIRGVKRQA